MQLNRGLYLFRESTLTERQKIWADGDEAKNVDFTRAHFWLLDDAGNAPIPILYPEDVLPYLSCFNDLSPEDTTDICDTLAPFIDNVELCERLLSE
jgi:hypothetical protein